MIFYFNHSASTSSDSQFESFENLMYNYWKLSKRQELHIEKGIVTYQSPRDIVMGYITLNELVKSIKNKELKRWIYDQLTKFPAEICYQLEEVYKSYEELDNSYYVEEANGEKIDATHLLAPSRLGWCVLSMPISDIWSKSEISLRREHDNTIETVISFNGTNNINFNTVTKWLIVKHYQDELISKVETRIAYLKNCVGKYYVLISPDFEARYHELAHDEQKNAIGLITTAFTLNRLFPIVADKHLIRTCKGKGNENTYELRDIGKGIRIYFQSYNNFLLLGGIHTKAEGVGDEQSADINRATSACTRLKALL